MEQKRYNKLNEYLKNKFGERTLKISVDGGFTCPNRDGKCGVGGCIYCSEKGSGELIKSDSISEEVRRVLCSYKAERANKFIIYFQNFTNTYDSVENLKLKYDSALIDNRIVGLAIGTRPDCINEEIAKLLYTYTKKYYVCVELGLQTSNDNTAKIINRGYESKIFTKAVEILNKYNIDVVAHIMVGLPGEDKKEIMDTVDFLNRHNLQGVKIHSTYIVENTKLNQMYQNGEYMPLDMDDYIEILLNIITNLNPKFVIHRIYGDAPKNILVAPKWNVHKMLVISIFEKRMEARNLWQGKYYNEEAK